MTQALPLFLNGGLFLIRSLPVDNGPSFTYHPAHPEAEELSVLHSAIGNQAVAELQRLVHK